MSYLGGKGKSFPQIINHMPPHRVYVETHLGGGLVMRHKRPASKTIGIDADASVTSDRQEDLVEIASELIFTDATDWLGQHFSGNELVYCNPPCVHSTRARSRIYRFELRDEEHRRLLKVLC